jgi:formate-dependent nitrite reductase cytochrome c552 subunit
MFELHITCTKDIEKLSIDFSDGTSVVQEKTEKLEKPEKSKKVSKEKEDFKEEDLSKYQSKRSVSQEIIVKPKIPDRTETKVDDILQELEF